MLIIQTKQELEKFLNGSTLLWKEQLRLYLFCLALKQVMQDKQTLKREPPNRLLVEIARDICASNQDYWFWYNDDRLYIVKNREGIAEIQLSSTVFYDICWSILNSGWYKNKGDNNND